ncbi:RidA family protein [Sphingomonas gei]|uniref:RidA family protein n=1 Tax=Sphingomonas gei TaxID=1395960 RepID=A0A4S1X9K0_9SPHN|nr:RidA family protein [Sphingomonas gei]TGX52403.1 RidA family protein [Sphingomonas gei]
MAERDAVSPANPHALYAEHRYSPAIRANGLLFVSGQVGARADGSPEPDTEAQIRLAFENLLGVLDAAGCTFDDVIDTTLYLVDPEGDFETLLKVMPEFWGEAPYPALTGIGVNWLAGFRFEIKVIARLPEDAQA